MNGVPEGPSATDTVSPSKLSSGPSRSKLACAACRATKVRCIRGPGFDYACMRCLRYGLACTPPAVNKRRGRPRRVSGNGEQPSPSDTSPDAPPLSTIFGSADPMLNSQPMTMVSHVSGNGPTSTAVPSIGVTVAAPLSVDKQAIQDAVEYNTRQIFPSNHRTLSSQDVHVHYAEPAREQISDHPSIPNGSRNLDLSEYLDPAERSMQLIGQNAPFFANYPARPPRSERSGSPHVANRDDPVNLMILSEIEALAMVQLFHDRLNHLVAVLDPKLHTLAYLRSTSTVLFSAVLAVASRFGRSDLHPMLLSHAQTLLDRAITSGLAEVGVAQAIMILTYWKRPADTSAWRKIGIALRIGYQLFWHVPRSHPLPADEMAARRILNVERTWMCLFCFDRGLCTTYGLPTTIRLSHIMDAGDWARGNLYLGDSVDMHLASSIELCKLKDQWGAICESQFPSSAYGDSALDSVHAQCEALLLKWWRRDAPPPGFEYEKEHVGYWSLLDFMLILKRHSLELAPNDPARVDACVSDATKITTEIEIIGENGDLEIMQDTSSCMTSSLVVLLRKIFHLATRNQKSVVISLLQRILAAYTSAAGAEVNSATAYVARFVRRTVRAIGTESRVGSPLGGQTNDDNSFMGLLGTDSQPDFMIQLQELMKTPEDVVGANDDDYWTTLFSTFSA